MRKYEDVSDYMSGEAGERPYRVLVPLDGSVTAEAALDYLTALAPLGDIEASIVAVADVSAESVVHGPPGALEREQHLLQAYVDEKVKEISSPVGSIEGKVLSGVPGNSVVEEAAARNADLIIISSHSRSGLERWRLGSVADKVVRAAPCDTLVIGAHARRDTPQFRSILLPVDGSDLAERAIPVARRLATALGADLHVVRAISPPVNPDMAYVNTTPDLLEMVTEAAETYVADVAGRAGAKTSEAILGSPAMVLLDYVEKNNIDLVVMTTHGRSGFMRAALGSVSDRLVGGPAPVFLVRVREPG
jgi:nucleotide-binding universal stress UspA family protein